MATTKKEMQSSITGPEKTTASHENTIREIEKLHHSDEVPTLQRHDIRLNSEVD